MSEASERLAVFRGRRDLGAIQPQGPLALVNTQWVDMEQTIWGVPGTWAPAPPGVQGLTVTAEAGDGITLDGVAVEGTVTVWAKGSDQPSEVIFSETQKGHVIVQGDSYALRVWTATPRVSSFGCMTLRLCTEWVVTESERIPGGKVSG